MALSIAVAARVPDRWVDAVAQIETNNRNIPGDAGLAAGVFQWHKAAWSDCTKMRKEAGLKTWPYSKAKDPATAREYASFWLSYLRGVITVKIGRPALLGEVWLAYNLGVTGFGRYGYSMSLVPQDKYIKAAKLQLWTK
jgi:hypothetical protein